MRRKAIERLLPGVYQASASAGTPLSAILDVMERLHAPDEAVLARIDDYFDPYLAPAEFVPFLAYWVDVDWLLGDPEGGGGDGFPSGLGHLRNVIATAPELSARRGTAEGLRSFLETATGISGFRIDPAGDGRAFHVQVLAPPAVTAAGLGPLVERIVEHERPAHATYEVVHEGTAPPVQEASAPQATDQEGSTDDDPTSAEARTT